MIPLIFLNAKMHYSFFFQSTVDVSKHKSRQHGPSWDWVWDLMTVSVHVSCSAGITSGLLEVQCQSLIFTSGCFTIKRILYQCSMTCVCVRSCFGLKVVYSKRKSTWAGLKLTRLTLNKHVWDIEILAKRYVTCSSLISGFIISEVGAVETTVKSRTIKW